MVKKGKRIWKVINVTPEVYNQLVLMAGEIQAREGKITPLFIAIEHLIKEREKK